MKQYLFDLFKNEGDLAISDILLHMLLAVIIACVIYFSYWLSHDGSIYSKKFNVSLVVLTVLTATVMTVIGNNIVLSLGMVGALSIVRYRTAIKDSRDTVYIFWAIIIGICCGVGDYVVASIGSLITFMIFLMFGKIKNDNRILIVIRAARENDKKIEALMFKYYVRKANLRAKNTTNSKVEYIYELSKKTFESHAAEEKSITDAVYDIGDIEYFNIISQNDDISS